METNEGITIQYCFKVKDLINADRLYRLLIDPRVRIASVIMAGFGIYSLCTNPEQWWIAAAASLIATAGWFGLLSWRPLETYRKYRAYPWMLGPFVVTLDEEGILISGISVENRVGMITEEKRSWDEFNGLIETRGMFVLIYIRSAQRIIPKHAFQSKEEIAKARELLRRINRKRANAAG